MINILGFLILIFTAVAPSPGNETSAVAMQTLTETDKARLMEKVQERGTIRVRITYDMDHLPKRFLGAAYQNQILGLHSQLFREMNYHFLFFEVYRKERTRPQIILTVDEETLLYLFDSSIVSSIREFFTYGHHPNPIIRH